MTTQILLAGFGGQGILFSGKFLAYDALLCGKEVSWLPSYGPEMRGGTASCSVIVSDDPIGSPIIAHADVLIAMNLPSLDKYEATVAPGGKIFVDSSLVERKVTRTDVETIYIPATKMASDAELNGLANMIIMGSYIRHTGLMAFDNVKKVMEKIVSAKHKNLLDSNLQAVEMGYNF